MLIVKDLGGAYEASAYSAQTNTWSQTVFPEPPLVASSRFVLGCNLAATREVWGYGAREARWQSIGIATCGASLADGNCLGCEHESDAGDSSVLAFSGVTNEFAFSPLSFADDLDMRVDHDVIWANLSQPGGVQGTGFSAYTGRWVDSPTFVADADFVGVSVRDKLIVVEALAPVRFEAMGALPQAWVALADPTSTLLALAEDCAVVEQPLAGALQGFSGVRGGWVPLPAAGPFTAHGSPDYAAVVTDGGGNVHAFSPVQAGWATLAGVGAAPLVGDCVAVAADDDGDAWGWSSRWGAWVAAPPADPLRFHSFHAAGSVAARVSGPSGGVDDVLETFDERSNSWNAPQALSALGPATLETTRNGSLVDDGGAVLAYSAQRGDLVASPGGLGLAGSRVVEEDVLAYRDVAGVVSAFGSPGPTHAMYDYPLDTETHHWSDSSGATRFVRVTASVPAGTATILGVSTTPFFAGLPTAFGPLFLAPPLLGLVASGTAGPGGVSRLAPVLLLGQEPEPFPVF